MNDSEHNSGQRLRKTQNPILRATQYANHFARAINGENLIIVFNYWRTILLNAVEPRVGLEFIKNKKRCEQ